MCVELGNRAFGGKLRSLRPGYKFFWNFTKIVKNKCSSVPTLKVNKVILITEQEKASAIAEKFSRAEHGPVSSEREELFCFARRGRSEKLLRD
jgi:hypothetical protein